MPVRPETYIFSGGLDPDAPFLANTPGRALDLYNYECLPRGGYQKVGGYALYDGSATPAVPPGEGPIRGVWVYESKVYAFRDQASAGGMFEASASGWQAVDLGSSLAFDNGTDFFDEGATVTGGTSGATATIQRVVLAGGTSESANLRGLLVLSAVSGTFQDNESLNGIALADGVVTANALPKGGKYSFANHNFFGQDNQRRMYGANGVGSAFEWNGTTFVPLAIETGSDFPSFVIGHKGHLMLGYVGGSIITSSLGEPTTFDALTGASEIAVGDEVTSLFYLPGGTLMVGCRDSVQFLYGNDATTWNLQQFAAHGHRAYTVQEVGGVALALDDRGLQAISPAQEFADFASRSISEPINEELLPLVTPSTTIASTINKTKSQYRLFLNNIGYFFTFNAEGLVGIGRAQYDHNVEVACVGESLTGQEISFFGDTNGGVYQMETTNFFAGEPLPSFAKFAFAYEGQMTTSKMYRKAFLEIGLTGESVLLRGSAHFDFDLERRAQQNIFETRPSEGGYWNQDNWNEFNWSADVYREIAEIDITGHGRNMALVIYNDGTEDASFVLYGATLHVSPRRLHR